MGTLMLIAIAIGAIIALIGQARELLWRGWSPRLTKFFAVTTATTFIIALISAGIIFRFANPDYSEKAGSPVSIGIRRSEGVSGEATYDRFISEAFLIARNTVVHGMRSGFGIILLTNRNSKKSMSVCEALQEHYTRFRYRPTRDIDGVTYLVRPGFLAS